MIVTHTIIMDLADRGSCPRIDVIQDDKYSRNLAVSLMMGDVPWVIPKGTSVLIRYCKSDGVGGEYDTLPDGTAAWSAAENVLTLALAPQVLTVPGTVMVAAELIRGEHILSTFAMHIHVRQRIKGNTQESEAYYNIMGFLPGPRNAGVGQFLRISQVDEQGNVLAVEGAEGALSGGGGMEPGDEDLPKVFLSGAAFSDMNTTKNEVQMQLRYISRTDSFFAPVRIKFQGNTSLTFPKKNFTIKMYEDEDCESKLKKIFRDWKVSSNKYVLKANWIDHTHARNIVSANLWSQIVASRGDYDTLPVELRESPRNGAIDGFPVKLYVNGTYHGIYTWNIGKDDWMWGMDEDNENHVLLCAETNNNGASMNTPCNFRTLWSGIDEEHWTVEVGTNSDGVKNALNGLISFVMNNGGEEFREGIGEYLDVRSAMDYYLYQYVICGLDGLAKNMLLATYDGKKWICGAYDLDATFGLFWNGASFVPATYACPEQYQETRSLLWERFEECFAEELKERYRVLRETVLSFSNMITLFENFMDKVGLDLYAEDYASTTADGAYTGIPSKSTSNIQQLRAFIRDRLAYVDEQMEKLGTIFVTGISAAYNGEDVLEGTALNDLDGIVVTAYYSDGSQKTVTDYTLQGAIAVGSNEITVTYSGFTAAFTVTGFAKAVPCTGITLSAETLSFTGEGMQSLSAAVTPVGCTDAIIWESGDTSIATVNGGVVTALYNGSTVITVRCGEYSASCTVNISGIPENIMRGVAWHVGEISTTDGSIVDTVTNANYTDPIDISGYAGKILVASCDTGYWQGCHIVFYNASNKSVRVSRFVSDKSVKCVVPDAAVYCRISLCEAQGNQLLLKGSKENLWESLDVLDGAYPNGVYNPDDTGSCHIRVPYDSSKGTNLWYVHSWAYTCLDENGTVLRYTVSNAQHTLPLNASVIATGTEVVVINTNDNYVTDGQAKCAYLEQIGTATVG